ncbi:hypothetical protein Pan258_40610 [Symmachiella dynata]|uniref:Tm-1-like ATP-binding domain-containing protein n=1 Tax=Symmachiella dynata TaxID=2527995 RepID=UPI00118A0F7B|nr:Tm-1-like ATP-binding domain-containing protein [Symmachiella dynata]QDT50005.1 hypothetical protein Pan258_40610 [Symmachiella dynata]
MAVYLIGTLDTKGTETDFVREQLRACGVAEIVVVDAGCLGEPQIAADITRETVFELAGTSLAKVRAAGDRGAAITLAAQGVAELIAQRHATGAVDAVLGLGGSAGTTIATSAMRRLPVGIPKLMVSTLASGQVRPYVGDKDILMLNAVVDIAGINRISRAVLGNAARAMAGMVNLNGSEEPIDDKPLIAATMFGVTTPCIEQARSVLEEAGYEVLVFHATGNGGEAMESLISDGLIAGVLDITTTELADELVGGVLSAGPDRLTAAGRAGIPQVISVGATDMVNFGPVESIPDEFADRQFYVHNPTVTLMRTTPEENGRLGEEIACKAAAATGPVKILLPLQGVSAIDAEGQPFDDPVARAALFESIHAHCGAVDVLEIDRHINDAEFATGAATALLDILRSRKTSAPPGGAGG